jgi:hypothetical protein
MLVVAASARVAAGMVSDAFVRGIGSDSRREHGEALGRGLMIEAEVS